MMADQETRHVSRGRLQLPFLILAVFCTTCIVVVGRLGTGGGALLSLSGIVLTTAVALPLTFAFYLIACELWAFVKGKAVSPAAEHATNDAESPCFPIPQGLWKGTLFFGAVLCVLWLPWAIASHPGRVDQDTLFQIAQFGNGAFITPSDHHPYFDTILYGLAYQAGAGLLGRGVAGVFALGIVQTVLFAFCSGGMFAYLRSRKVAETPILIALALYAACPLMFLNASRVVKDMTFALVFIPCLIMYLETCRTKGRYLRNWRHLVVFALLAFLAALTKKTGIYLVILMVIILAVYCRKAVGARALVALVCVCLSYFVAWQALLMPAMGVSKGYAVEAFSLPLQQIASAVADDSPVSDEQQEALEALFPDANIGELYIPGYADRVKDAFDHEAYEADSADFWRMYLALGAAHPKSYASALLGQVSGLLYPSVSSFDDVPNATSVYSSNEHYLDVFPQIVERRNSSFTDAYSRDAYKEFVQQFDAPEGNASANQEVISEALLDAFPYNVLCSSCAPTWLLVFILACAFACRLGNRRTMLAMSWPWVVYFLSLVAGPVVFYRYLWVLFFTMPLLACVPALAARTVHRDRSQSKRVSLS